MEKFKIYGPPISEKEDRKVYKVRIKESIEFVALKSYKRDRLHALQHAVQLRCTLRVRPSAARNRMGPRNVALARAFISLMLSGACVHCPFCRTQHRNVVEFIAWYATQNHIWIVEELCCGGSLAEVHAMDARLPLAAIRQFGRDLMEGLRHVHR
jgi:serine/threonine protein kinase